MRAEDIGNRPFDHTKQPLLYVTVALLPTFLSRDFLMPVQPRCNVLPEIAY